MNKRQHKKLVNKIQQGINLLEEYLENTPEEGSLVVSVSNDYSVGDIKNLLHCTKSQAYMYKQICKSCGVVIEKSWDDYIYDWVLVPTPKRVISRWGKKKHPDGYLNPQCSNDPYEWEEVILSMSVRDGGHKNYKDSVFLVQT